MPLAAMTELEAVNLMLATIGESPVNSLSETGSVDSVMARQALARVSREVQSKGWHFNTENNATLLPDAITKEITLPTNYMQVDTIGSDAGRDVVQRGTRLYDRDNRTFQFDKNLNATMILLLDWDDLPEAARAYIAIRAARQFQKRSVGGVESYQLTKDEEDDALVALKKFDGRTGQVNFLTDSRTVSRIAGRRGPLKG